MLCSRIGISVTLFWLPCLMAVLTVPALAEEPAVSFEKDIRPILRSHCFDCHGASQQDLKSGLDLRQKRLMLKGGDSGSAIEVGDADSSHLMILIESGEMPQGEDKLTDEQVELFRTWINSGAPTLRPEPEEIPEGVGISPEDRAHWAFQPITRPATPVLKNEHQIRTEIDAVLAAEMDPKGLSFSEEAPRLVLIRRAALDLTGLPPTQHEVELFLNDTSPDAYEQMVERYLAAPQYGERWGRHWLDVAGYADSDGMTARDQVRSYAYKYRDYIINAFNQDKPFNELIVEMLAGDELVEQPYKNMNEREIELLTATGYLRMAADGTAEGGFNTPENHNIVMADTIKIVSTSLLGMTVGCAQCHDHRYDPITQKDYYQMRAIFEPAFNKEKWRTPHRRKISLYTDEDHARSAEIEKEAQALSTKRNTKRQKYIDEEFAKELLKRPEELREPIKTAYYTAAAKRNPEQKSLLMKHPSSNITPGNLYQYNQKKADEIKAMDADIAKIRNRKPFHDYLRVTNEVANELPKTVVFHRGDPGQPLGEVTPAALPISATDGSLASIATQDETIPTTGRRLAYAKWLTSGEHPLVTRVMANRLWMHHFGRPIVATPGDFGNLGVAPEHPELLELLADELVQSNWSLKEMHRRIMFSTVYRQSSLKRDDYAAIDPENIHYWRKPLIRLDAEAIRDSMLFTSGKYNRKMFGNPIPVKEDEVGQVVVGVDKKGSSNRPGAEVPMNGEEFRRSVYVQVIRSRPHTMLRTFDAPQVVVNCEKRTVSTVAPQALLMMNSDFVLNASTLLAAKLQAEFPGDLPKQVTTAWERTMATPIEAETLETATQFLNQQTSWLKENPPPKSDPKHKYENPEKQALIDYCQALYSSNRFMYVD